MKIISIEKYKGKSYRLILDNDEHIYINADVLAEFGFVKIWIIAWTKLKKQSMQI